MSRPQNIDVHLYRDRHGRWMARISWGRFMIRYVPYSRLAHVLRTFIEPRGELAADDTSDLVNDPSLR